MAETLIDRLDKLAKAAQGRSDNSRVVADYLAPEIKALQGRTGHNIYAARMAVDHRNSARTDAEEAATLRQAATELEALRKRCEAVEAAFRDLRTGYVNLLETGRDRIMDLGGACDPVDVMERSDPYLRRAQLAIAAAQEPSHG